MLEIGGNSYHWNLCSPFLFLFHVFPFCFFFFSSVATAKTIVNDRFIFLIFFQPGILFFPPGSLETGSAPLSRIFQEVSPSALIPGPPSPEDLGGPWVATSSLSPALSIPSQATDGTGFRSVSGGVVLEGFTCGGGGVRSQGVYFFPHTSSFSDIYVFVSPQFDAKGDILEQGNEFFFELSPKVR